LSSGPRTIGTLPTGTCPSPPLGRTTILGWPNGLEVEVGVVRLPILIHLAVGVDIRKGLATVPPSTADHRYTSGAPSTFLIEEEVMGQGLEEGVEERMELGTSTQ